MTAAAAKLSAPPATPLHEALERAATEAHRIALGLGRIDAALGEVLGVADASAAASLQAADLLRQEVEGLSAFLFRLACQTDRSLSCDPTDAADILDLRGQALRLSGQNQVADADASIDLWEG